MKAIINILAGGMFLFLFTGCYVYQHVNVAGDAPQNDHSEFVVESDTVSIIYSFHGMGGMVVIDIFNKLDKPMYVDWQRSALIIDDESIVNEDNVSFIPPYSKIVVNSYILNTPFFNFPKEQGEKIKFYTHNGDEYTGRKYYFTPNDSPFNFRIFLSMSTDESFKTPFHFDNSFWVSDYVATTVGPNQFDVYFGNQFYIEKGSEVGNTLLYGALLGVLVLGGANAETVDY